MCTKPKRISMFLCALLVVSILFTSCARTDTDPEVPGTSGTTEEGTAADGTSTTAPDDPSSTTGEDETPEPDVPATVPQSLHRVLLSANAPVGRLLDDPVTVEIANGVTVDLNYLGWPSICVDENDVIYVAASLRLEHVDPLGATAFFKSEDGGVTWSEPRIIFDGPLDDRDAGLLYLGNGKMLVSWFTHYRSQYEAGGSYSGWLNFGYLTEEQKTAITERMNTAEGAEAERSSYVMLSDDYGETWGEPIRVPVSSPHGPCLMNDGTLLYVGREWNSDSCGIPLKGDKYGSYNPIYAFTSSDGGKTWQYLSHIAVPDNGALYCEPHAIQLSGGRILCAIRVEGGNDTTVPYGFTVYTCYSDDNGVTWTTPTLVEGLCGSPPHLLELKNGAVVMVYASRNASRGYGQRAKISYDHGETWTAQEITLASASDGDIGYPATVQLSDGTLVTIYYQRYLGDSKSSILCTRWLLLTSEEMREYNNKTAKE